MRQLPKFHDYFVEILAS